MKLRTVLIAGVVSAALIGGVGYGVYYSMQGKKVPVEVVPVSNVNTGYWGMTDSIYGSITSQVAQIVNLNDEYPIEEIFVKEGDSVKEGTPLFSYDMTLPELELEMEELSLQAQELVLARLEKDLAKLKNTNVSASLMQNEFQLTAAADTEELLVEPLPDEINDTEGTADIQPELILPEGDGALDIQIEGIEAVESAPELGTAPETEPQENLQGTENQGQTGTEKQTERQTEEKELTAEEELSGALTAMSEEESLESISLKGSAAVYEQLVDAIGGLLEEYEEELRSSEISSAVRSAVKYFRKYLADEKRTEETDEEGNTAEIISYEVKEEVWDALGEDETKLLLDYSLRMDQYQTRYVEMLIREAKALGGEKLLKAVSIIQEEFDYLSTMQQGEVRNLEEFEYYKELAEEYRASLEDSEAESLPGDTLVDGSLENDTLLGSGEMSDGSTEGGSDQTNTESSDTTTEDGSDQTNTESSDTTTEDGLDQTNTESSDTTTEGGSDQTDATDSDEEGSDTTPESGSNQTDTTDSDRENSDTTPEGGSDQTDTIDSDGENLDTTPEGGSDQTDTIDSDGESSDTMTEDDSDKTNEDGSETMTDDSSDQATDPTEVGTVENESELESESGTESESETDHATELSVAVTDFRTRAETLLMEGAQPTREDYLAAIDLYQQFLAYPQPDMASLETNAKMEEYILSNEVVAFLNTQSETAAAELADAYQRVCFAYVKFMVTRMDPKALVREDLTAAVEAYTALGITWQGLLEQKWQEEQAALAMGMTQQTESNEMVQTTDPETEASYGSMTGNMSAVGNGTAMAVYPSLLDYLTAYDMILRIQEVNLDQPRKAIKADLRELKELYLMLTDTQKEIVWNSDVLISLLTKYKLWNIETEPQTEFDWDDGFDDWGDDWGDDYYTAEELAEMIKDKEREIKDCELEIRESEIAVRKQQRIVDGKIVKSTMEGTVISIGDQEGNSDQDYFAKIANDSGLYAKGAMNELALEKIKVGDTISGVSTDNGMSFTAVIKEISPYPETGNSGYYGYGSENTNASHYPFYALINDSEGLEEGEAEIQLSETMVNEMDAIYLELFFVRTDSNGKSYVMMKGEDGLLRKQIVETGKTVSNYAVEIVSGLSPEDSIAFPYGDDVYEGALTKDVDMLEAAYM